MSCRLLLSITTRSLLSWKMIFLPPPLLPSSAYDVSKNPSRSLVWHVSPLKRGGGKGPTLHERRKKKDPFFLPLQRSSLLPLPFTSGRDGGNGFWAEGRREGLRKLWGERERDPSFLPRPPFQMTALCVCRSLVRWRVKKKPFQKKVLSKKRRGLLFFLFLLQEKRRRSNSVLFPTQSRPISDGLSSSFSFSSSFHRLW